MGATASRNQTNAFSRKSASRSRQSKNHRIRPQGVVVCVWRHAVWCVFCFGHLSNEKNGPLVGLGYIGDEILPRYIGIIINHYQDPYKPTRIQWKVIFGFFSWLTWSGSSTESMGQYPLVNSPTWLWQWKGGAWMKMSYSPLSRWGFYSLPCHFTGV